MKLVQLSGILMGQMSHVAGTPGTLGPGWYGLVLVLWRDSVLFVGSQSDKNLGKYYSHMARTHWRFLAISTWLVTSFIG